MSLPGIVLDRANDVIRLRNTLADCPPESPSWREIATLCEAAWQQLITVTGNRSTAEHALKTCGRHPVECLAPAATAEIVRHDGRTWVKVDPSALLHPSARGQAFAVGDHTREYHLVSAERFGWSAADERIVIAEVDETDTAVFIQPDVVVFLEIDV